MARNWIRRGIGATGLLVGAAGIGLWRWKRRRLDGLAAGSELLETDEGAIEVARQGSGYPVVVLHGSPGGYDQGMLVRAMFDDRFEVVAPSRPGFLRTPLEGDGSPADQAALLVAMLDELGIDEALFVGISAGAPYALQVAAEYPERVSGLVVACGVTKEHEERAFTTGNPLLDPVLTSTPFLDVRSALVSLYAGRYPDGVVEMSHSQVSTLEGEELAEYVEFVRTDPEQRARVLSFLPTMTPASARLEGTLNDEHWFRRLPTVDYGRIECPAFVVHGEYDALVPMDHAEYLVERVPDAELLRVAADHLAWVGPDADRAGREIRAFAERILSAAESPAR